MGGGALGLATILVTLTVSPHTASAVPSYARQTGQPCAACHTAFPELTPFGRQFKLGGYTLNGTRCGDVAALVREANKKDDDKSSEPQYPFSGMIVSTFTHTAKPQDIDAAAHFGENNNLQMQEASVFYGGQVYCNVGAFVQGTYEYADQRFFLDNADIRYADRAKIGGTDVVYGITANNNPTVQDVWNSTPTWGFPYVDSNIAPGPSNNTMIEGTFSGRVGGVGAYAFIDNQLYAELSAYGAFNSRTLTTFGLDPNDPTSRVDGAAPYWRLAYERSWDSNSLMFGTFGMLADVKPDPMASATDRFTDIGIDAQYQYITDLHAFTLKASYIWENEKLDASGGGTKDHLDSFRLSGTYVYDRMVSLQAGYFDLHGSTDANFFDSPTGSPDSRGYTVDVGYMPFNKGGPEAYPWVNGRIGVQWNRFTEVDGESAHAGDNDSVVAYLWVAF